MRIHLVLNDQISECIYEDCYLADRYIKLFLETYREAIKSGTSDSVLMISAIDVVQFSDNYYIHNWRNSISNTSPDYKYKQLLNVLLNKSKIVVYEDLDCEVLINDINSATAFICYQNMGLLFSFAGLGFDKILIDCMYNYILGDEVVSCGITLNNISIPEHLNDINIKNVIQKYNQNRILEMSGLDVWKNREDIFPNLVFCSNVENQLKSLDNNALFENVKKLVILESFFKFWTGGTFNYRDIPSVSPQSRLTLDNFLEDHTFETPYGDKIVASYHIKGAGVDTRVYFGINTLSQKAIICSVGKHLPIISDPNI